MPTACHFECKKITLIKFLAISDHYNCFCGFLFYISDHHQFLSFLISHFSPFMAGGGHFQCHLITFSVMSDKYATLKKIVHIILWFQTYRDVLYMEYTCDMWIMLMDICPYYFLFKLTGTALAMKNDNTCNYLQRSSAHGGRISISEPQTKCQIQFA